MGKYLLLMYNREMRMPKNPTKKQMEEGTRPWREYLGKLSKKGALNDALPVQFRGKAITATGTKNYRPQKVDLSGYMVINAKSMADAVRIAKDSPHARGKMGTTVIRECMEM